jgi:flavin reductase (DIM6/NTAB) family NADH-FMN oxidoreductase RutF
MLKIVSQKSNPNNSQPSSVPLAMLFTSTDFAGMERFYRGNLINSITGFKSLNLLGTCDKKGLTNLAVFSQILHLGADPALIGVLFRPQVPGMHSLLNIEETGVFTLSHIRQGQSQAAHWTSARWEESEFEKVGLEPAWQNDFPAPYVKGAAVAMGLRLVDKIPIPQNGTCLVIAGLEWLQVEEGLMAPDGFVDLLKAGTVAGIGLDGYVEEGKLHRFSYARPNQPPQAI